MSEAERRALRQLPESAPQRCLNRQVWIEKQIAAGMSHREIARRLGVDKTAVTRALTRFNNERMLAAQKNLETAA
jgi:transposase